MKKTERRAYAKVNLALDVLARREDGYHDIRSVMHAIDLYDRVIIRLIERGEIEAEADDKLQLVVSSDLPGLPGGEQNIAAKAARCFLAQQPAPESAPQKVLWVLTSGGRKPADYGMTVKFAEGGN